MPWTIQPMEAEPLPPTPYESVDEKVERPQKIREVYQKPMIDFKH